MKKLLCMLTMACLLLSGCARESSSTPSASSAAQSDSILFSSSSQSDFYFATIKIDPGKVEITDVLPARFPREYEDQYLLSPAHPDESYAAVKVLRYPGKSLGYQNDFEWVYAAYYPKFDDLDAPGADLIRQYYKDQYEKAQKEADAFTFGDEVLDITAESHQHDFLDWDSYTVGNYLVVKWKNDWYGGGIHGGSHLDAEQFDLRTGKLLTAEDVFGDLQAAAHILNPLITKHLEEDYNWHVEENTLRAPIDINSDKVPFLFRLEQKGIVFIYNEYAIDCYAAGAYQVLVPYSELQGVLKIAVP